MAETQAHEATPAVPADRPSIAEDAAALEAEFAAIDGWADRLKHLLAFADDLPPLPEDRRTEETRVLGCQSRVWLTAACDPATGRLRLAADSDARIMRGLLAMILRLYDDRTAEEIRAHPAGFFTGLSFAGQLAPARSTGLTRIVERIEAAAGADIGGAEVPGHVDAGEGGHQRAVAELARVADPIRRRRPVQDGLAVEADDRDVGRRQPRPLQRLQHGGRLGAGQGGLDLGEQGGFLAFETPVPGCVDGGGEPVAQLGRIGREGPGAERLDRFAVGAQHRDVDVAVQHRAGHQADRPNGLHGSACSSRLGACRLQQHGGHLRRKSQARSVDPSVAAIPAGAYGPSKPPPDFSPRRRTMAMAIAVATITPARA